MSPEEKKYLTKLFRERVQTTQEHVFSLMRERLSDGTWDKERDNEATLVAYVTAIKAEMMNLWFFQAQTSSVDQVVAFNVEQNVEASVRALPEVESAVMGTYSARYKALLAKSPRDTFHHRSSAHYGAMQESLLDLWFFPRGEAAHGGYGVLHGHPGGALIGPR